ncbi:MAG: COX15/CtaA family protein [Chitinophagales bacterium]|nr:COX15/CtaA family protein [Chitinophagales bacterium]
MTAQARKWISIWLAIGLILVFVQVVIGGITRLTDSGLSITEWELVKGVLPPTNEEAWNIAFEKYQTHAKKQYESIHSDMSLKEFKRIYFWEWFHRLWARSMGLIFIFPFIFFLGKKWIPKWLLLRLSVVIGLAAFAGVFGWIMVASGLNDDNRTWVSAYKLASHLLIATSLFSYLFYTFIKVRHLDEQRYNYPQLKKLVLATILVCLVQITFGAFMAGMRAGAIHPHWPFFLGNQNFLALLFPKDPAGSLELINYEKQVWIKAFVQVVHRSTALLLLILALSIYYLSKAKESILKKASLVILVLVGLQYLLGVLSIIGIIGNKTPVFLGVAHQGLALIFLASLFYYWYFISEKK